MSISMPRRSSGGASATIKETRSQFVFQHGHFVTQKDLGFKTITVNRLGCCEGTMSVDFTTRGGSATPGARYVPINGTLIFAEGETSKSFQIILIQDSDYQGTQTVYLVLSNPTGGAILGGASSAILVIADDDAVFLALRGDLENGQAIDLG